MYETNMGAPRRIAMNKYCFNKFQYLVEPLFQIVFFVLENNVASNWPMIACNNSRNSKTPNPLTFSTYFLEAIEIF